MNQGNEGIDLYEQGQYAPALDRLSRAYQVVQVPSLGLWYARALVQNGQLVEASERFLEVARSKPQADEPAVFAESRQKAAEEHQALQTRIPTVQISIEGAAPSEVAVVADGKALESVLIGVPVAMNPGTREVQASRGEETVTETVTLAEGEKKTVVLRFSGSPAAAAPAAAPATAGTAPPTGPSPTTTRTARHR